MLVDGASVNVVKSSGYNPKILEMTRINPEDWFEVTFRTLMGSGTDPGRVENVVTDARRCIPAVAFGGFRMEQILRARAIPVEYIVWPHVGHFLQSECSDIFHHDTRTAMRRVSL